jgi:hypothetical protein
MIIYIIIRLSEKVKEFGRRPIILHLVLCFGRVSWPPGVYASDVALRLGGHLGQYPVLGVG